LQLEHADETGRASSLVGGPGTAPYGSCRPLPPSDISLSMSPRRPGLPAACLLLALALTACAARLNPRIVEIPADGVRAVDAIGWIDDYPRALATIAAVLERELGLPPMHVQLRFYRDRAAFETGLIDAGYEDAFARETARSMDAIGGYRIVLLNESALARLPWGDRVGLLAHELAHAVQYELGGGRHGTSDQWLREGYAEWMACRVLETLGASSLETLRRRSVRELRGRDPADLPALAEMVTFRNWIALSSRANRPPIYTQAFLAADFLIDRHGLAAVTAYFQLFSRSTDRPGNFRRAFGEDLDGFDRAYREHLQRLLG
jgi:hypothetical protein